VVQRYLGVMSIVLAMLALALPAASPAQAVVGGSVLPGGWFNDPRPDVNPYAFVGRWELTNATCTASLVAPQWVLTAAHCAGKARVRFNMLNADRDLKPGGSAVQTRYVTEYRYQNDAPGQTFWGNTLLAKLDRPVEGITPVNLPTDADSSMWHKNSKLELVGWGQIDKAGTMTKELRSATEQVTDTNLYNPITLGWMKTESVAGSGDHGDSGGPLLGRNAAGNLVLIGVFEGSLGKQYFNRIWPQKKLLAFLRAQQ
jgi:hypothetical protein